MAINTMINPYLTVLMSVFNGERYICEALDSILSQTMPNFEFIVIDDGSNDRTPQILDSYRDSRIRIIHQKNQGLSASLNLGLQLAKTNLVARMDPDDIALPHRLETQLVEYQQLGHPDVMGTAITIISETGYPVGNKYYPVDHNTIAHNLIVGGPALAHPTVLYKRDAVLQCGGYDTIFSNSVEDYDLWLRMLANSRFANSSQSLLKYRLRANSISKATNKILERSPAFLRCVAKQRYLLSVVGLTIKWNDLAQRQTILNVLARQCKRASTLTFSTVSSALQVARVELLTPGLRTKGLYRALKSLIIYPSATLQYLITHRIPEPKYLTSEELECI